MRKLFTFLVAVLLTATVWAQSPQKMSYQAVIRNNSNVLVTNTQIGMRINIRQGTPSGTVVYTETLTPTTNANGLVSIVIGDGAGFNIIDWSAGPYFIETKTDPTGGTNYTITGTSQLLSVPYALHAKTAETVTGGITETDPVFTAWDKSEGISITESQISDLDHFTTADETDPTFGASVASGITATDTTNWNNKLDSETDPVFTAWDKSAGISITESQISDLDHFRTADETDPVYRASVARGITGTDITNWNNKLDSFTETDPVFTAWDKSTGISITESQISDLDHFTTADETDPVYRASVASGITGTDTTNWNNKIDSESDPVFTAWDKSTGISITESQISDLDHFTTADETDPVYRASVASGITGTDTTYWNNKLDSFTETDPVFTAWDKSTGISITESQISDLDHFTTADETDPIFGASVASGIAATDTTNWNNKLDSFTETDPIFGASVASGIAATDTTNWNNKLDSFTETDPSVPTGTAIGDMQYWNGTAWVTVPAGITGQVLTNINGVPVWKSTAGSTDVTNPATGKIWMDRNLGAWRVATSSTDADAYGDLYQWGRGTDGHQIRTSGTTATLSSVDAPGHGNFITINSGNYDWRSPQNTNLWQGVSGINNPCPAGYRLPTEAEWTAERASWGSNNNYAGAFGSPLKLPVAGRRSGSGGSLLDVGSGGNYWSSTVAGANSRFLFFGIIHAFVSDDYRAVGFSVRCIKN